MLLFRNLSKTSRGFCTAFQILLIGCFFLASHPQLSGPAGDDAGVHDVSLAALKHQIDYFTIGTNRADDYSQQREASHCTELLHRFRFDRVALLTANQPHVLCRRFVLSPLSIRAPPSNAFS